MTTAWNGPAPTPTTSRSPKTAPSYLRIVNAGYKLLTFTAAHFYLDRCRRRDIIPEPRLLIRALLPGVLTLRDPETVAWNLPVRTGSVAVRR